MAYTPTEWECGDLITAERMNKIETALAELSASAGGGGVDAVILLNNRNYAEGEDPRYNIVYGSYDAVRAKLVGDYDNAITGGGRFAATTMPVVVYGEESVGMSGFERGARTNYQFANYIRLWLEDEGFVDEEYISIQVNGNSLKWTSDGTIVLDQ